MAANDDVEMKDVSDEEDEEEEIAADLDPDEGSLSLGLSLRHVILHSGYLQRLATIRKRKEKTKKKTKTPRNSAQATATHNLLSATKAIGLMLFAAIILVSSAIPMITLSSTMPRLATLQLPRGRASNPSM